MEIDFIGTLIVFNKVVIDYEEWRDYGNNT